MKQLRAFLSQALIKHSLDKDKYIFDEPRFVHRSTSKMLSCEPNAQLQTQEIDTRT